MVIRWEGLGLVLLGLFLLRFGGRFHLFGRFWLGFSGGVALIDLVYFLLGRHNQIFYKLIIASNERIHK